MAQYTTFDTKTEGIVGRDYGAGYVGKRFQFLVWDRDAGKYQGKRYADKQDGLKKSRDLQAAFLTGQDSAGDVTLAWVLPQFMTALKGRGVCEAHRDEIEDLLQRAIDEGKIGSLKPMSVIAKAQKFIDGLMSRKLTPRGEDGQRLPPKPLSDFTRYRFAAHLRAVGNFCTHPARRWLTFNPFQAVERKTPDAKLQRCLGYDACARLVSDAALGLPEGPYWALRLLTGLRMEELAWLRWGEIHFDAGRIHVKLAERADVEEGLRLEVDPKKVKGRKERLAILGELATWVLKVHCSVTGPYVFDEVVRKRWSSTDRVAYHRHCKRLGIDSAGTKPHALRGANASLLLAAGLDTLQLRMHLGHEELDTTQAYADNVGLFTKHCKEWRGEIRLREIPTEMRKVSNGCTTAPAREGSSVPARKEEAAPEEGDFIILIPDNSELYRNTVLGRTGTCDIPEGPPGGTTDLEVGGSSPPRRASINDLDIACPS